MSTWWLKDFARVGIEKRAVERLASDDEWFRLTRWCLNGFRFCAEGVITAHSATYPVRLIYPDLFPSVPVWVEPQDPEAHWSGHQYGAGGTLCLELRPDNWVPSATGADVLRSAYHLLRQENPRGEGPRTVVASAHHVGEVQSYDWGKNPVFIGTGCMERLREGTAEDVRALRWSADDDVWPILVFDAIDHAKPQHPPSFDLGTLRVEVPVVIGRAEPPSPPAKDLPGLVATLGLDPERENHDGSRVVIAVGEERVTPFHCIGADSVHERNWVVLPDQDGLRSGRSEGARSMSVALVGLGSVGSKMAETLLRSGVHRFVLVDGDVLLPANLERHTLDWRDVGLRKAPAVKRRLQHIVPGARVLTVAENLSWQRSPRAHADQVGRLAACDLIIDATGDVPSALMLGALAAANERPFVSVEVFEGGLGCLVARSIPGRDPPYVDARASYAAFCEQKGVPPPPSGRRTYEALTEAGEPLVADDTAVTIAAAHAARVALDILDGRVGDEDTAWLLMGFRAGWLFDRHGHTIGLDIGPAPTVTVSAEEDEEARAFAFAIAMEALDAAKASA